MGNKQGQQKAAPVVLAPGPEEQAVFNKAKAGGMRAIITYHKAEGYRAQVPPGLSGVQNYAQPVEGFHSYRPAIQPSLMNNSLQGTQYEKFQSYRQSTNPLMNHF